MDMGVKVPDYSGEEIKPMPSMATPKMKTQYQCIRFDKKSPAFALFSQYDPGTEVPFHGVLNVKSVAKSESDDNYDSYVDIEFIDITPDSTPSETEMRKVFGD